MTGGVEGGRYGRPVGCGGAVRAGPGAWTRGVSQDADPQGVQVVRRDHGARARARRHRRGRAQRLRQVQRRRRHRLGARRAGARARCRSQKMDDVIFAGTAKRSALGRAEVRLTIDNTDGHAADRVQRGHDHPHAVPHGRAASTRSTASPCRLLDIQELLSDAGVGRQQHVIISQGQIDAVLNAKPEDRRADHRGSGRRPQVPQAQGEGRAPPRRDRGQPHPRAGPAARGPPPAAPARAPGRGRPAPRPACWPSCTALRIYLAGRELASLRTRLDRPAQQQAELRHRRRRAAQAMLADLDTAA